MIQCIIFKFRKWHTCNYEWYRLYRSYENCRRPGVAILDMQMSKVPIISGYGPLCCPSSIYGFWLPLWYLQTLLYFVLKQSLKALFNKIHNLTHLNEQEDKYGAVFLTCDFFGLKMKLHSILMHIKTLFSTLVSLIINLHNNCVSQNEKIKN